MAGAEDVVHQRSVPRESKQRAIPLIGIDIALLARVQENQGEKAAALVEILHQIALEILDTPTVNDRVLLLDENHGEAAEFHLRKIPRPRRKIAEGETKKDEQVCFFPTVFVLFTVNSMTCLSLFFFLKSDRLFLYSIFF